MNNVYEALFGSLPDAIDDHMSFMVLPDVTGGLDILSGGMTVATVIPDLFSDKLMDASGNAIGYFTDNVYGGTSLDLGMGDVITGIPNVMGGQTLSTLSGIIGYQQPDLISGGTDLYNTTGQLIASVSTPDAMDIVHVSTYVGNVPDWINVSDGVSTIDAWDGAHSGLDMLDGINVLDSTSTIVDVHDLLDSVDGLSLLTSWF